jgi:hypothetical protein
MAKQERIDVDGRHIGSVCRVPYKGQRFDWCIAGIYSGGRYETREAAIAELTRRYEGRHRLATDSAEG